VAIDRVAGGKEATQRQTNPGVLYRGPGAFLGIAPSVALMPRWRQDYLNNRPPTRAAAISEMGQEQPIALQNEIVEGASFAQAGNMCSFAMSCQRDVQQSRQSTAAFVPAAGEHSGNQFNTWSAHAARVCRFAVSQGAPP
jgi:hypothetical protein